MCNAFAPEYLPTSPDDVSACANTTDFHTLARRDPHRISGVIPIAFYWTPLGIAPRARFHFWFVVAKY